GGGWSGGEELGAAGRRHPPLVLSLLSVGEPPRRLAYRSGEPHCGRPFTRESQRRRRALYPAEQVVAAARFCCRGQPQVLQHGEAREEIGALEGARHATPGHRIRRQSRDRVAVEKYAAATGRELAGDHVEEGGLPRPIRADDRTTLALLEGQGHASQGGERAEIPPESLDGQERRRHERTPTRPRKAPTMPPGAKRTKSTKVSPRMSIQRSV